MPKAASKRGVVSKSKDGSYWRGTIVIDGKRRQTKGPTRAFVESRLEAFVVQHAEALEQAERDALAAKTWSRAFDEWIASSKHSVNTKSGHRKLRDAILAKSPFWDKTLADTTTSEISGWVNGLRNKSGEPMSENSLRNVLSMLRMTAHFAIARGTYGLVVSPVAQVRIEHGAAPRKVPALSVDQQALFMAEVLKHGRRAEARWRIGSELGVRPGEVLALTERSIRVTDDFVMVRIDGTLVRVKSETLPTTWVRQENTKTVKGKRQIPVARGTEAAESIVAWLGDLKRARAAQLLDPDAEQHRAELNALVQAELKAGRLGRAKRGTLKLTMPSDLLFPHPDRLDLALPTDTDRAEWRRFVVSAGLDPAEFPRYSARHTAATRLLEEVDDVMAVAEVMGHASVDFTRSRYAEALEERQARALATALSKRHTK